VFLAWLLASILAVLLLAPPTRRLVGWFVFELLAPVAIAGLGTAFTLRLFRALSAPRRERAAAEEEGERRDRLDKMRVLEEQLECALRDLRAARFTEEDGWRARRAEEELEESLRETRRAMAQERAALLQLEVERWLSRLEPLLRGVDTLGTPAVRAWTPRLRHLRGQGALLLGRLRRDPEARDAPAGARVEALLVEALWEIDALVRELTLRRAELLAGIPPPEGREAPEATCERLRARLAEARARREVRSWEDSA